MDVPEKAYGAYAYAPGVRLCMASDYYCYGKKEKVSHELSERERFSSKWTVFINFFAFVA